MSKQTGAHTHEEKGKTFQLFSLLQDWLFSFIGLFLGNMLLMKIFFIIAILVGYHIGKALEIRIGIRKTIESFRLIFIC